METENLEICARKRLETELREFQTDPPAHISCGPLSEEDMFHWHAIIIGHVGTPLEGAIFHLSIQFPIDYPFNPPKVQFQTQIFHPNIDVNGRVDISVLRDQWTSALSTETLLLSISSILLDPILEDIHYPVSNLDPILEDIHNPASNLDPIPKDIHNPVSNLDPVLEDIHNSASNLDWQDRNYCYKKPTGWKKKYVRLLRCWSRIKLLLVTKNQSDRFKPGRDK